MADSLLLQRPAYENQKEIILQFSPGETCWFEPSGIRKGTDATLGCYSAVTITIALDGYFSIGFSSIVTLQVNEPGWNGCLCAGLDLPV